MKKQTCFIALSVLALTLTACGGNSKNQTAQGIITQKQSNEENNSNTNSDQNKSTQGSNILIAYFTVPETDGVDAVASASRVVTADKVLGNTQFIATEMQKTLVESFLLLKRSRNIQEHMINFLTLHTAKKVIMHDLNLLHTLII